MTSCSESSRSSQDLRLTATGESDEWTADDYVALQFSEV